MRAIITFLSLLTISWTASAQSTGIAACDQVIKSTAIAAYGVGEMASPSVSILEWRIINNVKRADGWAITLEVKVASDSIRSEGKIIAVSLPGKSCYVKSLTID